MSANSTIPGLPPHIGAITGPRILGVIFQWGLFGVLCTQVYLYYLAFPKDPLRHKLFVYLIFAFEIIQTVIVSISAWNVFGPGYGNFSVYNNIALAWFSITVISGVVAFLAEAFYAYRISVLAESYWVAGFIMLLALVQLGGAFAAAAALKHASLFSKLLGNEFYIAAAASSSSLSLSPHHSNSPLHQFWNGGSAACDVIIAVCMTYYLSKRGSGGMAGTQIFLRRVIRLVIETGTITAMVAILNLILELLPNRPAYYQVPSEILAKVYSNSLMVMLNSRIRLGVDSPSEQPSLRTPQDFDLGYSRGADTFELSEGIRVTREELVFPNRDGKDKETSDVDPGKGYAV